MARRQSSTIYYKGSNHKEIYYGGHYHDKMYLGSQLVWEKLDGAIKWHGKIIDFCVFQNETYVIIKANPTVAAGTFTNYYIGKFDRSIAAFVMLAEIENNAIYTPMFIRACEDGLLVYKQSSAYNSKTILASYDLKSGMGMPELKEDTLSHYGSILYREESGNSYKSNNRIYGPDCYVEADYIRNEENLENFAVFRKYDYAKNLIASTEINTLFPINHQYGIYYTFYMGGNFYIADVSVDGDMVKILKTTDFTDTSIITLQTEGTGTLFYLQKSYVNNIWIENSVAYIGGKYKKNNLYYPCIFKFDGDNLTIEKTLADKETNSESRSSIPSVYKIDKLFIVTVSGAVYIGEAIDEMKRITYEDTSGYLVGFKNIACDDNNIYVTANTAYTSTQLVISKETLEITETKSEEIYKGV